MKPRPPVGWVPIVPAAARRPSQRRGHDEHRPHPRPHRHRHTEAKRDGLWNVQPLSAARATKSYVCPGCGLDIEPGVPHTVAWRADGLMGEADDLAARRHWHTHCWKIRS